MQTDDYKLIDQFVKGELDEAGRREVEAKARKEEGFAKELRFQQEVKGFFKHQEQRNALKEQLLTLQKSKGGGGMETSVSSKPEAKIVPLRRRILYVAGVAAAIAAVVFFAWPFLMPDSLYEQYNEHQPLALQERSGENKLITDAENAFNAGNYNLAYTKLTALVSADANDVKASLYLGIAAMETDRLSEAKVIFANLRSGQSAVKDSASWYLALTYVKEEDFERARNVLNTIPEESYWGGKAKELLSKL